MSIELIITKCMGCNQVKIGGEWYDLNKYCKPIRLFYETYFKYSHGYCEPCGKEAFEKMKISFEDMIKK